MAENSAFTHEPLPYIVVLRRTMDEDSIPEVHEYKVVAYSVIEAMLQATMEAGGTGGSEDSRFKVEAIRPDTLAWLAMRISEVKA